MLCVKTVEWVSRRPPALVPGVVRILDQTLLPNAVQFVETAELGLIRRAIETLQVRGAPAIGVAAAMGVAAAAQELSVSSGAEFVARVEAMADDLARARPTAVNLAWALERMKRTARAASAEPPAARAERLVREAILIRDEDAAMCRAIGRHGVELVPAGKAVLTHCNAGALATAEFGTALAPIYVAAERGGTPRVYVDETRPLLQGARLTAWELQQAGIEATLICDNTAAQVMKDGRIGAVFVGADRIAANGDTANKIGTYGVAVLARAHGIPFYVFAPTSTFDLDMPDGSRIPIEERSPEEVTCGFGKRTAPAGIRVYSPAFDVTPAELISAIVCEKGVARPDFSRSLKELARR